MTYVANLTGGERELYDRLYKFVDFKTSTDLEQRKVWQLWFKELEKTNPSVARELMNDVNEAQYKSHGEVWQGSPKKKRR